MSDRFVCFCQYCSCVVSVFQTMLLEKWRVCQQPEGESNFLVFSQMLAGISTDLRSVYTGTERCDDVTSCVNVALSSQDRAAAAPAEGI